MSERKRRIEGSLLWWARARRYGFASVKNGKRNVFVHAKELRDAAQEPMLKKGALVSFVKADMGRRRAPEAKDIAVEEK